MKNKKLAVVLLAMVFVLFQAFTASAQISITEILVGNLSSLSNSASVSLIGDNSSASTSFDTADSDPFYSSGFSWWTGFQPEYLPVNARLDFNSGSPGSITLTRHVSDSALDGVFGLGKTLPQTFLGFEGIALYLNSYDSDPLNTISLSNIIINDSYTLGGFSVNPGESKLILIETSFPITSFDMDVYFGDGSPIDVDTAEFRIYGFDNGDTPVIIAVPEPSVLALSALGFAVLFFRKKGAHTS